MESALTAATRAGPCRAADPTAFGYGDFNFSWGDHICAVFDHPDQQMAVMLPFVTHGLRGTALRLDIRACRCLQVPASPRPCRG